ncbi:hypothetical protein [Zoogloea sp.]|uniref:lipopolysaccharide biosynthesis protein n=1 Tax=Zoogloea sp. TaxID=49181 RepID=UPI002620C20F|nr:hypothetical protein [Zoogloea sp.]
MRGATLLLRFFLVFFLAKLLEPSDLGVYGLVGGAVAFSLYVIGLDFYVYSNRELLELEKKSWGRYLKGQVALSSGMYGVFLLVMFFLAEYAAYSKEVVAWMSALALLEFCCQELNRLHVITAEPLFSSFVLFIRQGLWIVVAILLMATSSEMRNINTVFICWSLACVLALAISIKRITQLNIGGWKESIDWAWVFNGVKTSLFFLVGTLSIRALLTFDRFYFESLMGVESVGVYVFYIGVASALMTFLDAGVFVFAYPDLIRYFNEKKHDLFKRKIAGMLGQVCIASLLFTVISLIALPWLVEWISKPAYDRFSFLYFWLLGAMILYGLSMVPHYGLYAIRKDVHILASHVFGFIGFFLGVFFLRDVLYRHELVVPIALCASFFMVLAIKSVLFVRFYLIGVGSINGVGSR